MGFEFGKNHTAPSPRGELVVHAWLDAEGGKFDKALGRQPETPTYQPKTTSNAWGRAQPSPKLDASIEGLREALRQYQQLDIDPRLDLDIDNCKWEDVFRCMADAQADYEKKATKWRGCVRRLFRQAGDVADNIDPLLDLIPDQYGLGVLSAGIALIFMLAKAASQTRATILAAFEEIPAIVASGQAKLKLEPNNEELQAYGNSLNVTILISVSELVGYLLPERYTRNVPYFWFKRRLSHSDVEGVLTKLRKDADELKNLVRDLLDAAIFQTRDVVLRTEGKASAIMNVTSQINGKTDSLRNDAKTIKYQNSVLIAQSSDLSVQVTNQSQILEKMQASKNKEYKIMMEMAYKNEAMGEARGTMEHMLQEAFAETQRKNDEIILLCAQLSRIHSLIPLQGLMSVDQFLLAIGAVEDIEQSTADVEKVLQLRSKINPAAEAEAVSLLQTAVFRDWLHPDHSDVILIDGAGGAVEFIDYPERVSAKSILCAVFLSQLTRFQPNCFKIYFFCGLHSSKEDALSDGPRGLMRGLLCDLANEAYRRQLLQLGFIKDKRYRDGLQQQDIRYFCDTFYKILQHMNVGAALDLPIYCVIDGIAQYEKQEWLEDLGIVMGMFRTILNDTELVPYFKLLLTGPHRVRHVHEMVGLPPDKRLPAKPAIVGEDPRAQREMQSDAEQILQTRALEMVAQRSGQSQYHDNQYSLEDYE